MRITQAGSLIQLTFLPGLFPVNCYLVEEKEGLTLVDAAMGFCLKGILKAARAIGKPIRRIVLTHAHLDHVGALDAIKEAFPNAPVHISARDARLLAGDSTLLPDEPPTPVRGSIPKGIKTKADVLLREGDRVGSLRAYAAPGHTPGSMAFLDTRSRALIAGDAFQTWGGMAVSGQVRPLFPFPAMATWNKQEALATARRLRQLRPTLLAVGHGDMLRQPDQAMERAIRTAEHNLAVPQARQAR